MPPASKHIATRHPNALAKHKRKIKEQERRRKLMQGVFGANAFRAVMARELTGARLKHRDVA